MSEAMRQGLRHSFVGAAGRYFLQTASIVILARLLSPEDFGIITAAMIVVSFAFIVLQVGGASIVSSAREDQVDEAFTVAMLSSITFAILIGGGYLLAEREILNILGIQSKALMRVLLAVVFIRGLLGPLEGIGAAKYEFKVLASSEVISYFCGYFLIAILSGYLLRSYWALVLGLLSQSILHLAFLVLKIRFRFEKVGFREFKSHLQIGFSLMANKVVSYGLAQADNIFINSFMGKSDLGIYSRAYQLMVIPTNFIGQVVGRVFIPYFRGEITVYCRYRSFNIALSAVAALFALGVGEKAVVVVLGPQWVEAYKPLIILAFAIYYRVDFKFFESVFVARREGKKLTICNVFGLLGMVIMLVAGAPSSIEGVALVVLIANAIQATLGLCMSYRSIGVNIGRGVALNATVFILSWVVIRSL